MGEVIEHGDLTSFGAIGIKDNAVETAITVAGTYVQCTVFGGNGGAARGTTPDHTNDHITLDVEGTWDVSFSASIIASANEQIAFDLRKNNGSVPTCAVHTHTSGRGPAQQQCVSSRGIVWGLEKDDTLELWVANLTSTDNITIENALLMCVRLGGYIAP